MIRDRLFAAVTKSISQRIDDKVNHISLGSCESLSEYTRNAGEIAGLREALRVMEDESRLLREDGDVD